VFPRPNAKSPQRYTHTPNLQGKTLAKPLERDFKLIFKMIIEFKKNVLLIGTICAICIFATAHNIAAQTIQFQSGSCELSKVVEFGRGDVNKWIHVDFKYAMNDDIEGKDVTKALINEFCGKGEFVVKTKRYQYYRLDIKLDEQKEIPKNGEMTVVILIPNTIEIDSINFVIDKQSVSLKGMQQPLVSSTSSILSINSPNARNILFGGRLESTLKQDEATQEATQRKRRKRR